MDNVTVFEAFSTFLSLMSDSETMMFVCSLLRKSAAFMFLVGSECALRLCKAGVPNSFSAVGHICTLPFYAGQTIFQIKRSSL